MSCYVVQIILTHQIRWFLHRDDSPAHDLLSFSGWPLINPLAYGPFNIHFHSKVPSLSLGLLEGIGIRGGHIVTLKDWTLIKTDVLMFASTAFTEGKEFKPTHFPQSEDTQSVSLRKYDYYTSIKWKQLKIADKNFN